MIIDAQTFNKKISTDIITELNKHGIHVVEENDFNFSFGEKEEYYFYKFTNADSRVDKNIFEFAKDCKVLKNKLSNELIRIYSSIKNNSALMFYKLPAIEPIMSAHKNNRDIVIHGYSINCSLYVVPFEHIKKIKNP